VKSLEPATDVSFLDNAIIPWTHHPYHHQHSMVSPPCHRFSCLRLKKLVFQSAFCLSHFLYCVTNIHCSSLAKPRKQLSTTYKSMVIIIYVHMHHAGKKRESNRVSFSLCCLPISTKKKKRMFTREELIESNEFTQRERDTERERKSNMEINNNTKVTGELLLLKYLHEKPYKLCQTFLIHSY